MAWPTLPPVWIAAQSKRSANHLDLDLDLPDPVVGHDRFDEAFFLDVDDEAFDLVQGILTKELCDWAVQLDEEHGPLIVVFDGAEPESGYEAAHGSAVFVAREVSNDDEFVATLAITTELVGRFRTSPGNDLSAGD